MSDPEDWKATATEAVATATELINSSAAAGQPEIAQASLSVTYVLVNGFLPTPGPEAVSDQAILDLEETVKDVQTQIAAESETQTYASKCQENFDRGWRTATTKMQKFSCLSAFLACLVADFRSPKF